MTTCDDHNGKELGEPQVSYIGWHMWAAKMGKTHKQERCGECGLWKIWVIEEEE